MIKSRLRVAGVLSLKDGETMEPINFDFSPLAGYYNAKINLSLASAQARSVSSTQASEETATSSSDLPWRQEVDPDDALRKALGAASFLPDSVARDARDERGDVPKIFAAYSALASITAIAQAAKEDRLPVGQESRAQKRMLEGILEVKNFLASVDMQKTILITGERLSAAQSEAAITRSSYEYNTKVLHSGEYDAEVAAFTGDKVFTVTAKKINTTESVTIDLADMEATTGKTVRNLDNVAEFINFKLEEAGIRSSFVREKIGIKDENGVIQGDDFGFKIKGVSTETLSFSAADATPAAIMVGQSGMGDNGGGQLSVWTGIDGGTPVMANAARLGEDGKETNIAATAVHPDGGYVVVGTTEGVIGESGIRGDEDTFMARYDSQGQMVWSRTLGAATSAEGLALAVSDDGKIAITGKTSDELITNAIGGGDDTFVTMYDADGIEQWTRQRGSTYDDQGNSIAFAADGSLVIGGTTAGSMTEDLLTGGKDAFIEKLDADGNQLWLRQFGTTENDSVKEVKVADDGSVIVASIENGEAILRRYASGTDDPADWTHSLGNLNGGDIGALEIADDGTIYLGGSTRTTGTDATGFTTGTQSDRDGFVASINVNGGGVVSTNWLQRIGGSDYQSVEGLKVSGSELIIAGTGEGEFGTATSDKDQSAFLSSLSVADGTQGWSSSLSGRGGISSASDVILSDSFSNTLDAFGLPDGDMVLADTAAVTDRLSIRPGDHFYVSVDGGRDKKITVEQGDNLRSLTFKLNAALVLDGKADVRRSNGAQSLKITPNEGVQIELKYGAEGRDALAALGLPTGVIMEKPIPGRDSISDSPEIVALGLLDNLNFDTKESRDDAFDVLEGALRGLRTAYRWAVDDPTLLALKNNDQGPGRNSGGAPPAYLTAQIANLQAGLQRLTAGGGGFNFFA